MNLPNKITLFRVILIPVFLVALLSGIFEPQTSRIVATIIFIIASATDALDGYIARKYKLITNFGKFMDPLADKLLVCAALIAMVSLQDLSSWVVILIVSREFIITGLRLIAADNNVVIAASVWGKSKTITQMLMIIVVLSGIKTYSGALATLSIILIALSVVFTIISAVDYILKNLNVFNDVK